MTSIQIIALVIFVIGYLGIALEHCLKINKSAVALGTGIVLWLLAATQGAPTFFEDLTKTNSEIFAIFMFLLAAMSLVEVLVHYRFFDVVRGKIFALGLDERKQFLVISFITFFLSAMLDNLTTTIVMIQIARKFFKEENFIRIVATIVIAANAGGAFSPLGDVTTIMLWLAGKFSALEVISRGFLPSLAVVCIPVLLLYKQIQPRKWDATDEIITSFTRSEKIVITLVLCAFALPIVFGSLSLPPYLGILLGLSAVWMFVNVARQVAPQASHLGALIREMLKKTDISSLTFFVGILLAIAALHQIGVLETISHVLFGQDPSQMRIVAGSVGLGLLSAIVDNVPLTAMAIQLLNIANPSIWVLFALTLGTGGSLLIIGSAAGVVAMGMVEKLTFGKYFRIAFVPSCIGFFAGVGVWAIQYFVFGF